MIGVCSSAPRPTSSTHSAGSLRVGRTAVRDRARGCTTAGRPGHGVRRDLPAADEGPVPEWGREPACPRLLCGLAICRITPARDALLGRITEVLETDPRVTAAWLSGSFGRSDADAWSDFDLHVAVEDGAFAAFLAGRDDLYRCIGSPLLVQHDMASRTQPGSRYQLVVYPRPVEVDWIVGPASEAVRPPETRILFARREVPVAIPPPLPVATTIVPDFSTRSPLLSAGLTMTVGPGASRASPGC